MSALNNVLPIHKTQSRLAQGSWNILLLAGFVFFCRFNSVEAAPLQAQVGASSVVKPAEVDETAFVDFQEWAKSYEVAATFEAKVALEARGLELAKARREVMFQFIVFDPQRALEYAVPAQTRQILPALIIAELEVPLSGRSEFAVLAAMYTDRKTGETKTRIRRSVVLNGMVYNASVYGARLGVTSKTWMAWHGIALDNYIALEESPFHRFEDGETPAPGAENGNERRCPLCEEDAFKGIAVDVGGVTYFFDTEAHLKKMEAKVQKREATIGPEINGLELLESLALKRNPPDAEQEVETEVAQD